MIRKARNPSQPGRAEGRCRDADVMRKALLRSAAELFAEHGFDKVRVRAIGHRANVDPSLINRYFGGKEDLFSEVVKACHSGWRDSWSERVALAEKLVDEALFGDGATPLLLGAHILLRSSGSERARRIIDATLGTDAYAELEAWVGGENADIRARLLMATIGGVMLARDLGGDFDMSPARQDALRAQLVLSLQLLLHVKPPNI